MAFIDKAGEVLGKVLTETVEDPQQLRRGLELLVRGATLPDPDDSTGDFRQSAYDLGRFRQETRRREQEDLSAAKAAEAEAKRQQELDRREFEIRELNRRLEFQTGVAERGEREHERRHKERMTSDKATQLARATKNAKEEFYNFIGDESKPPALFFNPNGKLNRYGVGVAVAGKLDNIINDPKLIKKMYRQKQQEYGAYLAGLNKGTKLDRSNHINYGGAMLNIMNSALPTPTQVNLYKHPSNFGSVTSTYKRVPALMDGAGNEWLNNFSNLTSRYFLTVSPDKISKQMDMPLKDLKENIETYKAAIQNVIVRGPLTPAPGFNDFLKSTVLPLMRKTGADEFFRKAFQVKKFGTVIEGNEGSASAAADYNTRTHDLSFLRDDPLMTKVAIGLGVITKEEVQAIVSTLPARANTVTTISTPTVPTNGNKTASSSSRPRSTTTVKLEHNINHFPGEIVTEVRQFYNNIDSITNDSDRNIIRQTLKYAKDNYMGLSDLERYNLYTNVYNAMERNKQDFLAPEASINPYTIYALSLIDSTATKHTEIRGGRLVEVSLTRNSQRPRYKIKNGKPTQELTDEFKRRGKSQAQRMEIDLQLLGMMRLNDMAAKDMGYFGEEDYEKVLKPLMGTGAEVKTSIEGMIGTIQDVVKGFFGNYSGDLSLNQMGTSMSSLDDLENNSMYSEASRGTTTIGNTPVKFSDKYGFQWNMNRTNRDRMTGLRQLAQEEDRKILLELRENMTEEINDGKRVMRNISQDQKREYYTNYLKRTALLWEKTALTYRLAGYVQGDQTGGRTISNQDFDNVYHALWGGKFFTEFGARNALRYLKFKNNEAMQRGVGEDFLVQARGQTFTSNDRHINMIRIINDNKMDRFYRNTEENGPEVKSYMTEATHLQTADSQRAYRDVKALINMNEGFPNFQGIPKNTKENASRLKEMSDHIETAHHMTATLDTFVERKSLTYEPTLKEVDTYKSIYDALKNRNKNSFGQFLANNAFNYKVASKAGKAKDFPEMLKGIAEYTKEIYRLISLVESGKFNSIAEKGKSSSLNSFNILQLFSSSKLND